MPRRSRSCGRSGLSEAMKTGVMKTSARAGGSRRCFLLGALLGAGRPVLATAAQPFPYGDSHVFAAWRNDQLVGHHALRFRHDGERISVSSSLDLSVRMLGLTVYKYNHRCREVWNGDRFERLAAETLDDGKLYLVRANDTGGGVAVEHEGPVSASAAPEGQPQRPLALRDTLAAGTLPTSHWNIAQVHQRGLLNTQLGILSHTVYPAVDHIDHVLCSQCPSVG